MLPANTARAYLRFLLFGQQVETHVDALAADPFDVSSATAFASGLAGWAASYLMPALSHNAVLTEIFVKADDPDLVEVTYTGLMPLAGSASSDALPSQMAGLISLYSAFVSRSGRGRMFLPGIPSSGVANGILTPTFAGILTDVMGHLTTLFIDNPDLIWVIASLADGEAYPIVSTVTRTILGGLNRRRIGRGS